MLSSRTDVAASATEIASGGTKNNDGRADGVRVGVGCGMFPLRDGSVAGCFRFEWIGQERCSMFDRRSKR